MHKILSQLATANDRSLGECFLWVPSHSGSRPLKPWTILLILLVPWEYLIYMPRPPSGVTEKKYHALIVNSRNGERDNNVSVKHYGNVVEFAHKYRRHELMTRGRHVVGARLRLGHRPVGQVSRAEDVPHSSSCKLCDLPDANSTSSFSGVPRCERLASPGTRSPLGS